MTRGAAADELRFHVRKEVAIEDFGERSLALLCDALQLREINAASRRILALLDGERTVKDIGRLLAAAGEIPAADAPGPVAAALLRMEAQGLVGRRMEPGTERPVKMSATRYLADPDVSFRPEDDEGGILYHPGLDLLEAVNPTAAEIWIRLRAPRTRAEVTDHLCAVCAGASRAQVERDVEEFLGAMVKKGFVGVVEDPA